MRLSLGRSDPAHLYTTPNRGFADQYRWLACARKETSLFRTRAVIVKNFVVPLPFENTKLYDMPPAKKAILDQMLLLQKGRYIDDLASGVEPQTLCRL